MGDRIKVGVLGYGRMGRLRAELVQEHAAWDLRGICDPYVEAGELPPGVQHTTSYEDLLALDLDAVYVCTPNHVTAEAVSQALRSGRHVFAEKPPGRDLADAQSILRTALEYPQSKLKFGFNHRYHDSIREAKALVDQGRFGPVLWARGVYGKSGGPGFAESWRNQRELSGGGILLDQGIHMVDLLRLFLGDFEEVKSFVDTAHWPIDVDDNAFAILRNSANQVAMLHSSATQWKHVFSLEICMAEGYAAMHGILSSTRSYGRETLIVGRRPHAGGGPETNEEIYHYDHDRSWERELEEFTACIQDDHPVSVGTIDDAVKAMELVEVIYDADSRWQARRSELPRAERARRPAEPPQAQLPSRRRVVVTTDLHSEEVRPRALYNEYQQRTLAAVEPFFQAAEFERTPCPACASEEIDPGFSKGSFTYVLCRACATLYASPRPSAGALARYYEESPAAEFWRTKVQPTIADARRERLLRPRAEWLSDLLATSGLTGALSYREITSGYSTPLIDQVRELGLFASTGLLQPGEEAPPDSVHVVAAFETLERSHDPARILETAARALAPGGLFVFTAMSISGLDLQILWEHAANIFPPDRINVLSIEGFQLLADRMGFEVQELSTPGQLDLEMLANTLPEAPNISRFWRYLLTRRDANAQREFQELLQKHRLSSYLRGVFRREM